jgi:Ca2+-binding EF-hand superfamily protein
MGTTAEMIGISENVLALRMKAAVKINSRDALADMERQFKLLDTDGNGELDIEEFCTGMSQGEFESMTWEQAEVLFRALDADGGGTLDFDEFIEMHKKNMELASLMKFDGGNDEGEEVLSRQILATILLHFFLTHLCLFNSTTALRVGRI